MTIPFAKTFDYDSTEEELHIDDVLLPLPATALSIDAPPTMADLLTVNVALTSTGSFNIAYNATAGHLTINGATIKCAIVADSFSITPPAGRHVKRDSLKIVFSFWAGSGTADGIKYTPPNRY